jgi:peptidoglycan/xylan/chitin deacetylase (PgdA/CDA1 family)
MSRRIGQVRHQKPLAALVTVAVALTLGVNLRDPAAAGTSSGDPAERLGPAVSPDLRSPRTVALTFDDGPSPYTPQILAVLRREHVRATFCMLGTQVRRYPAIARAVVRDGHQLCDHSRDHRDLARLSASRAWGEVADAQRAIRTVTGITPTIFRFPYGSSSARSRRVVARFRLRRLSWDVDPQDWTRPPAHKITSRIVTHAHPRCVVLMHDGGGDRSHTAASLSATIRQLRKQGYRFVYA